MNAKHDLAEALCQLLETKTLEKITVKDIVARCGVNRQTFYYHFHDVYDLMRWIFEREAANLAQTVREAGGDWRQELHTITDVLRSKRHLVMNAYRSVNRRDLERYLMQGYGLGVYLVGILPHGVFELTALILACTLGLLISRTGTDRLRRKKEAVPLWPRLQACLRVFLFAVVPLLALAALIEAYITPVLLQLVM